MSQELTRSQRHKYANREAREIQNILSAVMGGEPSSIPVCDCCIGTNGNVPQGCRLQADDGIVPQKGFCRAFQADPKQDPRNEQVLLRVMKKQSAEAA